MKILSTFYTFLAFAIVAMSWARTISEKDTTADTNIQPLNNERIVGGTIVDISVHPHQISLRGKSILRPANAYSHTCGGSIITDRIVATAAHCVIGKVASQYQVVAGANYIRSDDGVIIPAKELIMHEQYDPDAINNDIALVVLKAPLPINNYTIKPIELASEPLVKGATATISGWGTVSYLGRSSNYLQEIKVPVLSNEECNEDYDGDITDAMLCAGLRGVGGKDSCQGDSGGPLVVNGKLAGIVSWGYGCAFASHVGVYTNVPYFLPWVREKVAEIEASLLAEN